MRVRVKKKCNNKVRKINSFGDIKEVLINEDLLNPGKENVAICFQGRKTSGIINLSPDEFEMLYETVRKRMQLIKGVRIVKD